MNELALINKGLLGKNSGVYLFFLTVKICKEQENIDITPLLSFTLHTHIPFYL